jgi:hypothetical protein
MSRWLWLKPDVSAARASERTLYPALKETFTRI